MWWDGGGDLLYQWLSPRSMYPTGKLAILDRIQELGVLMVVYRNQGRGDERKRVRWRRTERVGWLSVGITGVRARRVSRY